MGMFTNRKQTKKSYLMNAIIAVLIGIFMVVSALLKEDVDAEYMQGTAIGVGIMLLLAGYWLRRHLDFDKASEDNGKKSKTKQIMDKLGL